MPKLYKVGCAHCGKLVGEFDLELISKQEGIKKLPKHTCCIKRSK